MTKALRVAMVALLRWNREPPCITGREQRKLIIRYRHAQCRHVLPPLRPQRIQRSRLHHCTGQGMAADAGGLSGPGPGI